MNKMKESIPIYIGEIKDIVYDNKVYPLKELFMQLRKTYPEIGSMRNLKENIETYIEDFSVNSNNLIISKNSLKTDILAILSK